MTFGGCQLLIFNFNPTYDKETASPKWARADTKRLPLDKQLDSHGQC